MDILPGFVYELDRRIKAFDFSSSYNTTKSGVSTKRFEINLRVNEFKRPNEEELINRINAWIVRCNLKRQIMNDSSNLNSYQTSQNYSTTPTKRSVSMESINIPSIDLARMSSSGSTKFRNALTDNWKLMKSFAMFFSKGSVRSILPLEYYPNPPDPYTQPSCTVNSKTASKKWEEHNNDKDQNKGKRGFLQNIFHPCNHSVFPTNTVETTITPTTDDTRNEIDSYNNRHGSNLNNYFEKESPMVSDNNLASICTPGITNTMGGSPPKPRTRSRSVCMERPCLQNYFTGDL